MSKSDDRYSRVEREVLEILDGFDEKSSEDRPRNVVDFKRPKRARRFSMPSIRMPATLRTLTPAKLLIATVLFALLAVFAQGISSMLATALVLGAVVSFIAIFFVGSGAGGGSSPVANPPRTKRWRGRDIDLNSPGRGSREGRWSPPWRGPKR